MKIVHIITGLNNGGAEMMLYKLLSKSDRKKHQIEVISMLDKGVMGNKLEALDIKVHTLNLGGKNFLQAIKKGIEICKTCDVIQCWMYHANLFGYVVNLLCHKKLLWGIRRGKIIKGKDKTLTIMITKVCAFFSHFVDKVIYCADESRKFHEAIGYDAKKSIVIPNGFELDRFFRSIPERKSFREKEGIGNEDFVIAFVGRYSNVKGYHEFVKAVKIVIDKVSDKNITVVCAGKDVTYDNKELADEIEKACLQEYIKLLGRRDDIPSLLSAADLYVSASFTEAFSNAIGEAMACEVPCVVTDVGDSAYIVGSCGKIVADNTPEILAAAMLEMINSSQEALEELGQRSRKRVSELFEINRIALEYENLY